MSIYFFWKFVHIFFLKICQYIFLKILLYRVSTKKVALTLEDHSTPFKIVVGIKVGGVTESAGADLSVEYHNFPVAQEGAEIFEFKVEPSAKINFFECDVWSLVKHFL